MTANFHSEAEQRALRYAEKSGLRLVRSLGSGFDGIVFATDANTAVKSLVFQELYLRERDVYKRLLERRFTAVGGFQIPQLIGFDDELLTVEVSIVQPPFILDFAAASLDKRPDFPDELWDEWDATGRENFEDRWDLVRLAIAALRGIGIHVTDPNPRNIRFE